MTVSELLNRLKARGEPRNVEGMRRYGITTKRAVSAPDIRSIAKEIGKNQNLSLKLWSTGVLEARALASLIGDPKQVTERQMERWVKDFDSWAVCDACCGNIFDKTPSAYRKAFQWCRRKEEFVRRAGYAMMAELAVHDKHTEDNEFLKMLQTLKHGAKDKRNFVKKAVNWALRQIGKRNLVLHRVAIRTAVEIKKIDSPIALWIATDALRELQSAAVQRRLEKKKKRTSSMGSERKR